MHRLALYGAVAAGLAGLASPATARDVFSCTGPSREGVIACCEKAVGNRLPDWMALTAATCRSSVSCAPAGGGNQCRIVPKRLYWGYDPNNFPPLGDER